MILHNIPPIHNKIIFSTKSSKVPTKTKQIKKLSSLHKWKLVKEIQFPSMIYFP